MTLIKSYLFIALCISSTSFAADIDVLLKRLEQQQLLALGQEINARVHHYIHGSSNITDHQPASFKNLMIRASRSRNPLDDRDRKKRFLENARQFFSGYTLPSNLTDSDLQVIRFNREDLFTVSERFAANIFSNAQRMHKDGSYYTLLELLEWSAKNSVLFGVGNCFEMTALAFVLSLEYQNINALTDIVLFNKIEVQFIGTYVEHGHDYMKLIGPHKTEVIIDPWSNETFLVGDPEAANPKWLESVSYSDGIGQRIFYPCLVLGSAALGEGHSERWKEKYRTKDQPALLSEWLPTTIRFSPFTMPINRQ